MDKMRERGAPLPGNDKENWGNRHTGIWRKREEGEEEEEKKKRRKEKREEVEIEEFSEEEEGHGDDKLIQSKANEWGKLGWNWNNRNEEECEDVKKKDEEENWRMGKENAGSEMEEKREQEWKAATREKEGNIKEY